MTVQSDEVMAEQLLQILTSAPAHVSGMAITLAATAYACYLEMLEKGVGRNALDLMLRGISEIGEGTLAGIDAIHKSDDSEEKFEEITEILNKILKKTEEK